MLSDGLADIAGTGSLFTITGTNAVSLHPENVLVTITEYVVVTDGETEIILLPVFPFDQEYPREVPVAFTPMVVALPAQMVAGKVAVMVTDGEGVMLTLV